MLPVGCQAVGTLTYFADLFRFHLPLVSQGMQTSHMSRTLTLTPFNLLHLCARYLRAQFKYKLNARSSSAPGAPPTLPLMLPVALASELDIISATLVEVFSDRS